LGSLRHMCVQQAGLGAARVTFGLASSSVGTCSCSSWWRMSCGSRFSVRRLGRLVLPCDKSFQHEVKCCGNPERLWVVGRHMCYGSASDKREGDSTCSCTSASCCCMYCGPMEAPKVADTLMEPPHPAACSSERHKKLLLLPHTHQAVHQQEHMVNTLHVLAGQPHLAAAAAHVADLCAAHMTVVMCHRFQSTCPHQGTYKDTACLRG
jgi:hypothetical protein